MNECFFLYIEKGKISIQENILIKSYKGKQEFIKNLQNINVIIIIGSPDISYSFINYINLKNINTFFISKGGKFKGYYVSSFQKNPFRKLKQYEFINNKIRKLEFAKKIVFSKIMNQIYILRLKHKTKHINQINHSIKNLLMLRNKIETIDNSKNLMGIEGQASKIYFFTLNFFLKDKAKFLKRTIRPPKDGFNALLSFGYTLLYIRVLNYILISNLDPLFGFLHTDSYSRASLALDLMEIFRQPIVDSVCINFANSKYYKLENLEKVYNGIYLGKKMIGLFTELINNKLKSFKMYNNNGLVSSQTFDSIIYLEILKFIKAVENEHFNYDPFYLK